MPEKFIRAERQGKVALLRIERRDKLNALCDQLMDELRDALLGFDADPGVSVIVLTGFEKAFAAGADIAAMRGLSFATAFNDRFIGRNWDDIRKVRKPIIAAVAGYALGGGCELALMCDIVIAADNALFGLPEIRLGVVPGAGGTQRLPRVVGKSKAMELCLTGESIDAREALALGLVSKVVPLENLEPEALAMALKIAAHSLPAIMMVKECIDMAFETPLAAGLKHERHVLYSAFALKDQKEGMAAFLEKRSAAFSDE